MAAEVIVEAVVEEAVEAVAKAAAWAVVDKEAADMGAVGRGVADRVAVGTEADIVEFSLSWKLRTQQKLLSI